MKKYLLKVEVEPLEEGGYLAICNDIQGCHAEGDTVAEALETLEDVARILLELRKEDGLPLPEGLESVTPNTVIKAQVVLPRKDGGRLRYGELTRKLRRLGHRVLSGIREGRGSGL